MLIAIMKGHAYSCDNNTIVLDTKHLHFNLVSSEFTQSVVLCIKSMEKHSLISIDVIIWYIVGRIVQRRP